MSHYTPHSMSTFHNSSLKKSDRKNSCIEQPKNLPEEVEESSITRNNSIDSQESSQGSCNSFSSLVPCITPPKLLDLYDSNTPSMENTTFEDDDDRSIVPSETSEERSAELKSRRCEYVSRKEGYYEGMQALETDWDTSRYPSGRLPLIPLENSTPPPAVIHSKVESHNYRESSHNNIFSWIRRSFCTMSSTYFNTALNFDQCTNNGNQVQTVESETVHDSPCTKTRDLGETPIKASFCGLTACCKENVAFESSAEQQKTAQQIIDTFLGSNGTWCNGWQTWYSITDGNGSTPPSDPKHARRVLRNRVYNLNARTTRIQRLRHNLSPFEEFNTMRKDDSIQKLDRSEIAFDKKIHSFSEPSTLPVSQASCLSDALVPEVAKNYAWDAVSGCGRAHDTSSKKNPSKKEWIEIDDSCYDSDPGEVASSSLDRLKPAPRRSKTVKSLYQEDSALDQQSAISAQFFSFHSATNFNNLQDIMHTKITLIWHRANDNKTKVFSPVAVKAWIELGSQLRSALIQPKFMWQPEYTNGLNEHSRCGLNVFDLHCVDLLDISRVLIIKEIDRNRFPLAKRSCSFVVESFENKILFEASSERYRNWVVDGLKLMVARLGSKIIVGDDDVLREFFTPVGASVPGDKPEFAFES